MEIGDLPGVEYGRIVESEDEQDLMCGLVLAWDTECDLEALNRMLLTSLA